MENYKGIIWIRNTSTGSKSDGNKAYFIDSEFKHYQLYQKGVYEINDPFFYPYHLKTVEITAEIQKEKWMMVQTIKFIENTENMSSEKETYKFKKSNFDDILNSGGPILSIVEQNFVSAEEVENYRLWLRAYVKAGVHIYAKVNETALLIFFQGRLSVRELFLLRNDEKYVIEEKENTEKKFKSKYYSEQLDNEYLRNIPCAELNYYSIPEGMRLKNPFDEVIKKLDLFFINSHESQPLEQ